MIGGGGVGGVAGLVLGGPFGVFVGVLVVDEVVAADVPSHSVVVGVLSGVGEGGMHGSSHSDLADTDVMVLSGVGDGGIAGSAHRDLTDSDVIVVFWTTPGHK